MRHNFGAKCRPAQPLRLSETDDARRERMTTNSNVFECCLNNNRKTGLIHYIAKTLYNTTIPPDQASNSIVKTTTRQKDSSAIENMSGETKANGEVAATASTTSTEETKATTNAAETTTAVAENGSAPPAAAKEENGGTTIVKPPVAVSGEVKKESSSAAPSEIGTEDDFVDEDDVDAEEEELFKSLEQRKAEEDLEEALHPSDKPKTVASAPALLKAAIEAGEVKAEDEDGANGDAKDKKEDDTAGVSSGLCLGSIGYIANYYGCWREGDIQVLCGRTNIFVVESGSQREESCFDVIVVSGNGLLTVYAAIS